MKSFLLVLLLTTVLIVFGTHSIYKVENFTESYNDKMDSIETSIGSDEWNEAYDKVIETKKSFHEEKNYYYKLLDHEFFDMIALNLNILEESITLQNKSLSLEQIEIIKMTLETILESEIFDLNHII